MTTYIDTTTLPPLPLPPTITSRYIKTSNNSLTFHILESKPANYEPEISPAILLIHGFPELAFSWRHILPLLSSPPHGYHAIALDQRGYGRTHPLQHLSPLPPSSFRPLNLIRDILTLISALGLPKISCVVGHDFGSVTASLCALARPDIFQSVILMSHPTKGPPALPFNTANGASPPPKPIDMESALGTLNPPRKHYKWYYCTSAANDEMTYPTGQPLHEFLRGYFHLKSADWAGNYSPAPHKLVGWEASELAKMPTYYVMSKGSTMREDVATALAQPSTEAELSSKPFDRWLSSLDLDIYVQEYGRNTFQGGLNWYRVQTQPDIASDVEAYSGLKISVPCMFVAGEADWGTFQEPGAVEAMESGKSVDPKCWKGVRIVKGAGHWVNQEQPEVCVEIIGEMVESLRGNQ